MAATTRYKRDARGTREYVEGVTAFASDTAVNQNPYPKGFKRWSWYVGYLDARTYSRLLEVFERWDIGYIGVNS